MVAADPLNLRVRGRERNVARSTRRSRPISIDHHVLRRRVGWGRSPHSGRGGWALRVTVFSSAGGTSRLVAEADPESYRLLPLGESDVSPRYVEAIIRHAVAAGWDPVARGRDFRIADFVPIILEREAV